MSIPVSYFGHGGMCARVRACACNKRGFAGGKLHLGRETACTGQVVASSHLSSSNKDHFVLDRHIVLVTS